MSIRKMALVAAIGTAMASAPVMAQPTAPLARASATMAQANAQDDDGIEGFPWLIIFVVIAIGAGLYFAISDDDENPPTSP